MITRYSCLLILIHPVDRIVSVSENWHVWWNHVQRSKIRT